MANNLPTAFNWAFNLQFHSQQAPLQASPSDLSLYTTRLVPPHTVKTSIGRGLKTKNIINIHLTQMPDKQDQLGNRCEIQTHCHQSYKMWMNMAVSSFRSQQSRTAALTLQWGTKNFKLTVLLQLSNSLNGNKGMWLVPRWTTSSVSTLVLIVLVCFILIHFSLASSSHLLCRGRAWTSLPVTGVSLCRPQEQGCKLCPNGSEFSRLIHVRQGIVKNHFVFCGRMTCLQYLHSLFFYTYAKLSLTVKGTYA